MRLDTEISPQILDIFKRAGQFEEAVVGGRHGKVYGRQAQSQAGHNANSRRHLASRQGELGIPPHLLRYQQFEGFDGERRRCRGEREEEEEEEEDQIKQTQFDAIPHFDSSLSPSRILLLPRLLSQTLRINHFQVLFYLIEVPVMYEIFNSHKSIPFYNLILVIDETKINSGLIFNMYDNIKNRDMLKLIFGFRTNKTKTSIWSSKCYGLNSSSF